VEGKGNQHQRCDPDMTIGEKIRVARDLFTRWGEELWAEASIRGLLEALREKVAASAKVSLEVGLFEACQRCDEEDGGSCCGVGIENRYSPHLLLISLLLGQVLPAERRFANSCYFLGADGCVLLARDILCINYLCAGVQKSLAHENLVRLQTITGEEMETVFLVHEAVKHFLNGQNHDH
jgi:hypothetical protein